LIGDLELQPLPHLVY